MEVFIADNILKTFSLSYKHVILGYYIKDRSLKDVGFIINFVLFLCKFHIHKCKFKKTLFTVISYGNVNTVYVYYISVCKLMLRYPLFFYYSFFSLSLLCSF